MIASAVRSPAPATLYPAAFALFRQVLAAKRRLVTTAPATLRLLPGLPLGVLGYCHHEVGSPAQPSRTTYLLVNGLDQSARLRWPPGCYPLLLHNEHFCLTGLGTLIFGDYLTLAGREAIILAH